mgnify:CR=1 FL=1
MNKKVKTYKFSFSKSEIKVLRSESRDDYNCISEIEIKSGSAKISFWNQYCAILYRIDETVDYLNTLELATDKYRKHAFDLYAFISQADVIVQATKLLGKTFKLEKEMDEISDSTACFGDVRYYQDLDKYITVKTKGTDGQFWEYLRSITTVHPNETSKSNFLHSESAKDKTSKAEEDMFLLHVSPYAMWQQYKPSFSDYDGDIDITVYLGKSDFLPRHITVHMQMIVNYMHKWISFLNVIAKKIDKLNDERIDRLKGTPLKVLGDFEGKVNEFLDYLELEYKKRYHPDLVDNDNENFFSRSTIGFFETKFNDLNKQKLLDEFLNALLEEVNELRNAIQNMKEDPCSVLNTSPYMLAVERKFPGISDFSYQFEKLGYIDMPYVSLNEDYQQSDLEKKILSETDRMIEEGKPVSEISQSLSAVDQIFNLGDEMWGRFQAYLISKMLLKDNSIDFTLNHWKVYVQLALAFWKK